MKSLFVKAAPSIKAQFEGISQNTSDSPWLSQTINQMDSSSDIINELNLLAPTLAQLSEQGRWIVLVGAPKQTTNYLNTIPGLDSARILLVHPNDQTDALWAMEQALMSGNSSAVLGWPGQINSRDQKRLRLAAKRTSALAFVFSETDVASPDINLNYQDDLSGLSHTSSFH